MPDGLLTGRVLRDYGDGEVHFGQAFACLGNQLFPPDGASSGSIIINIIMSSIVFAKSHHACKSQQSMKSYTGEGACAPLKCSFHTSIV